MGVMVDIDGRLVNRAHVVSAEIETSHYMNGSNSRLVVRLTDGSRIIVTHGFGFNVWDALADLKGAI